MASIATAATAATLIYHNGDRYIGKISEGDENKGKGRFTCEKNGAIYEGEFINFSDGMYCLKMHGNGTFTFSDGDVYSGGMKDSQKHGQGTYTYANGDTYAGQFENNNYDGIGTYTCADGSIYTGEYKNDKIHGYGTYTWASGVHAGQKYVGNWKNETRNGQGTQTLANGTIEHSGEWQNDTAMAAPYETKTNSANATEGSWVEDHGYVGVTFDLETLVGTWTDGHQVITIWEEKNTSFSKAVASVKLSGSTVGTRPGLTTKKKNEIRYMDKYTWTGSSNDGKPAYRYCGPMQGGSPFLYWYSEGSRWQIGPVLGEEKCWIHWSNNVARPELSPTPLPIKAYDTFNAARNATKCKAICKHGTKCTNKVTEKGDLVRSLCGSHKNYFLDPGLPDPNWKDDTMVITVATFKPKRLFKAKTVCAGVVTNECIIMSLEWCEADGASCSYNWNTSKDTRKGAVLKFDCTFRDGSYNFALIGLSANGKLKGYSSTRMYLGGTSSFRPFEAVRVSVKEAATLSKFEEATKKDQDFYLSVCKKVPSLEEFKKLSAKRKGIVIGRLADLVRIWHVTDSEQGAASEDTFAAEERLAKYKEARGIEKKDDNNESKIKKIEALSEKQNGETKGVS